LSDYGSYLGRAEGCFEVRDKTGKIERYPHFEKEIGEAVLKSGSYVSVDALIDLALWNIDTYIMTKKNRVVAVLKNLDNDSHVKTRLCQYDSLTNGKGLYVPKRILKAKLQGQNAVLKKYGLKLLDPSALFKIGNVESDSLKSVRKKLIQIESHKQSATSIRFSAYFLRRLDLKEGQATKRMTD
jgi:CRISPR/Cas system-associated endonuclease Cas1